MEGGLTNDDRQAAAFAHLAQMPLLLRPGADDDGAATNAAPAQALQQSLQLRAGKRIERILFISSSKMVLLGRLPLKLRNGIKRSTSSAAIPLALISCRTSSAVLPSIKAWVWAKQLAASRRW